MRAVDRIPGLGPGYGLGAGSAKRVAGPWTDLQLGHMNRISLSFFLFLFSREVCLFPRNRLMAQKKIVKRSLSVGKNSQIMFKFPLQNLMLIIF